MNIRILLTLLCMISALTTQSRDVGQKIHQDSITHKFTKKEFHKQKATNRNLHYNILGGPAYTPNYGFLLGGTALMTFHINPEDSLQQRSVLPFVVSYMVKGGVLFGIRPQLFFKNDRIRVFGEFMYNHTKEDYYGVGYATTSRRERGENTTKYTCNYIQIKPQVLFKLGKSNFFIGPQMDIYYEEISDPAKQMVQDEHYTAAGGTERGYHTFNAGLGFLLSYDSRDVPANAYSGLYLNVRGMTYNKMLGSDENFFRLEVDYRQYYQVKERGVLAWTVQTKHVFGTIPINQYSFAGTAYDLRGYYTGQYRDRSAHVIVTEYRQMINNDQSTILKRLLSHVGYVAWTGCGFMGPAPAKIEGVLPNVGIGLRVEIQPRMNVRLDYGRDMVNNQNLFYFNMTEAF